MPLLWGTIARQLETYCQENKNRMDATFWMWYVNRTIKDKRPKPHFLWSDAPEPSVYTTGLARDKRDCYIISMTFPTPRSYKTHCYCKTCSFWHKLTDVGKDIIFCPTCNMRVRKNAHSSLSKSIAGKQKNKINQTKTRAGISLIWLVILVLTDSVLIMVNNVGITAILVATKLCGDPKALIGA